MTFAAGFAQTFRAIASDRSAFGVFVLATIFYSFYYPTPYQGEVLTQTPIAVVDEDRTPLSRELRRLVRSTQGVRIAMELPSMDEAQARLASGEVDAIMWIGPMFEQKVLQGRQGDVLLFANNSVFLQTGASLTALSAAVGEIARTAARLQSVAEGAPAPPVLSLVQRPLFNTREGYGSALVPAVIVVIAQQLILVGIAMLVAGSLPRVPVGGGVSSFLGVTGALILIGCVSLSYFSGVVLWFQDYPRNPNFDALLVLVPVFAAAIATFGLLLASFFDTPARASQALLPFGLVFFFLSGFTWPTSAMPQPVAIASQLIPSSAGIQAFVRVNQMGATVADIAPELAILGALTLAFGVIAWLRLRTRSQSPLAVTPLPP